MYQHPGNDVTGIIARSEKVAGACEEVKSQGFYHIFIGLKHNLDYIIRRALVFIRQTNHLSL